MTFHVRWEGVRDACNPGCITRRYTVLRGGFLECFWLKRSAVRAFTRAFREGGFVSLVDEWQWASSWIGGKTLISNVGLDESHTHDSTALLEVIGAVTGARTSPLTFIVRGTK